MTRGGLLPTEERWAAADTFPTDPVRIEVETEWGYGSSRECICCPGLHAYTRGADVTRSDVPSQYDHMQAVTDHVQRAIGRFGDGRKLVIEVRLADQQTIPVTRGELLDLECESNQFDRALLVTRLLERGRS